MSSNRGASVGVTITYTSDRLGQEEAEDVLLDLVGKKAPEHPDCTVLKVFVFEAGEESLFVLLRNWWLRRRKVRPEVRPELWRRRRRKNWNAAAEPGELARLLAQTLAETARMGRSTASLDPRSQQKVREALAAYVLAVGRDRAPESLLRAIGESIG